MAVKRFSRAGKREMDKPLNLIPFISFLSVVVSFLIATAAWNQLVQIEVLLPSQGAPAQQQQDIDKPILSLTIIVTVDNLQIAGAGGAIPPIPMIPDPDRPGEMKYDLEALDKMLKDIQKKFPDNRDAILAIEGDVLYEKIINVLDVALKNNITGLSMTAYTRAGK